MIDYPMIEMYYFSKIWNVKILSENKMVNLFIKRHINVSECQS